MFSSVHTLDRTFLIHCFQHNEDMLDWHTVARELLNKEEAISWHTTARELLNKEEASDVHNEFVEVVPKAYSVYSLSCERYVLC